MAAYGNNVPVRRIALARASTDYVETMALSLPSLASILVCETQTVQTQKEADKVSCLRGTLRQSTKEPQRWAGWFV